MSWLTDLRERAVSLLFRRRQERELGEELEFHLLMEQAANEKQGMGAVDARRLARLKLGGLDQTREAVRDARGVRPLADMGRDIRLAIRSFGRSPGFTMTAVLVLGLGIGATTAIFSAVRAVILRPLPFSEPGSLYMLWEANPEVGSAREPASPPNYLDWRKRVTSFADVEAYSSSTWQVTLSGLERPVVLDATNVTGGFFSMLGVRPMLGRDFTEAETWASATWRAGETPLILSEAAWRTVFGAEEAAVGKSLFFNNTPARIVGVMSGGVVFPSDDVDVWVPFGWAEENVDAEWFRQTQRIRPVARIAAGATPERAAAELQSVAKQLEREHPALNGRLTGGGISPLQEFLVEDTRAPLLILLGAVGLLLLIACANVGNLILVRASARRRDLAVRTALGAGRGRLVRQMLTESLVLAALGGLGGIAFGIAGTRLLERFQPGGLLRVSSFPVDAEVVGFAIAATAAAAMLFGLFPVFLTRRVGSAEVLREAGRSRGGGRGARRAASGLVVAEVALAVLLALGAGLLVRSILELRQVDPGFDPEGVVAITLSLPGARYPGPVTVAAFYRELLAKVRVIPGVEAVAASSTLPLRDRGPTSFFFIAGRAPDQSGSDIVHRIMTPGYLETMGVPLLAGRAFTDADFFAERWDEPRSDRVALINETMARQYFPGQNPVGQRITTDRVPDSTSHWRTIVGVVGNERQSEIATPPQIELIEPFGQTFERQMHVFARVAHGEPTSVVPAVQAIIRDIDPELPLYDAVAMEDVVSDSMARDRFLMLLLLAFASVALVLALVGVYGVTAQAARQRLPELGLRMALGAVPADLVRLTVGRTAILVTIGLGVGLLVALLATRAAAGLLYGVAPNDPVTFVIAPALFAAAALCASWLPARRAANVDPARTLQAD